MSARQKVGQVVTVAEPTRFALTRSAPTVATACLATTISGLVQTQLPKCTTTARSASSTTSALTNWTTTAIRRWPPASIHPDPTSAPAVRVTEEMESNANVIWTRRNEIRTILMKIGCHLFIAVCDRPCQNGGRCVAPNQCSCRRGFEGEFCEADVNECERTGNKTTGHQCHANSECRNMPGWYACACKPGFRSPRQDILDTFLGALCQGASSSFSVLISDSFWKCGES